MITEITAQKAYDSLNKDEAILIDVREQDEYEQWHIKEATLAPLSNLPAAMQQINLPKDKKIIIHCLKGGRSAEAILYLHENILKDYDVYNLAGGILAWQEDGLPINTST